MKTDKNPGNVLPKYSSITPVMTPNDIWDVDTELELVQEQETVPKAIEKLNYKFLFISWNHNAELCHFFLLL